MEKLKLIEGKFNSEEAKEILLSLINSKIQFHTINEFSLQERTGESKSASTERIKELLETKKLILSIIEKSKKENLLLDIHSTLNIDYCSK
tara:strand:+ start:7796 stop:8068 length:273 start_codon:yes stop_codon:yes gene_type:complete